MSWPLFYKDDLVLGNSDSPVGIATLWTVKDRIKDQLQSDQYCAIGNLYTPVGINSMLKNILAKPTIRYLVLCGADLNNTAQALINFMEKGIDGDRKIADCDAFIDSNIPEELIDSFRKNVQLIDMRGKEAEISTKLTDLPKETESFCEPVEIPEEKPKEIFDLDSNLFCTTVRGKDICHAWLKVLDTIMKFGEDKKTEYTSGQKEVLNLTVVVEGDTEKLEPWMQINEEDLEIYYPSVFSPEKPEGVHYAYGERLFGHPLPDGKKFNQIEAAIEKLKKNAFTRRACAVTWNVRLDGDAKEDQPCVTMLTWNVKNGKLIQTVVIRSNDMFDAWPRNAFALRKLQKMVAEKASLEVGPMVTTSISAHIYEHSFKTARDTVNKHYRGGLLPFDQDKFSGYFAVKVEDGEIHLQHHLLDGRPTVYKFSGKKSQTLYRQLTHENLIHTPDHLAYIGHQLARAEECLKSGQEFVQDEA